MRKPINSMLIYSNITTEIGSCFHARHLSYRNGRSGQIVVINLRVKCAKMFLIRKHFSLKFCTYALVTESKTINCHFANWVDVIS